MHTCGKRRIFGETLKGGDLQDVEEEDVVEEGVEVAEEDVRLSM